MCCGRQAAAVRCGLPDAGHGRADTGCCLSRRSTAGALRLKGCAQRCGARWFGGNGGLSLRSVRVQLEVLTHFDPQAEFASCWECRRAGQLLCPPCGEDGFFAKYAAIMGYKVADQHEAESFGRNPKQREWVSNLSFSWSHQPPWGVHFAFNASAPGRPTHGSVTTLHDSRRRSAAFDELMLACGA